MDILDEEEELDLIRDEEKTLPMRLSPTATMGGGKIPATRFGRHYGWWLCALTG